MDKILKLIKDHWIKPLIIFGLFLACLAISILMKKWFGMDGDYLSAFATLVAAVVAAYLFNDWREQKDHETKTIYLNNAIKALGEIHISLISCRSNSINLKTIRSNLIIMPQYIDDLSKQHSDLLITLYSNLEVVKELSQKFELLEIYHVYDKYIYIFDDYNQKLLSKYKTYFFYFIDRHSKNNLTTKPQIFRPYSDPNQITNPRDPTFAINAIEVDKFFGTKLGRIMGDKKDYTYYDQHILDCIDIHDKFFKLCVKALRAH